MNAITSNRSAKRRSTFRDLVRTISLAMCKLNQIQFEAPWNPRRQGC